MGFLNAIPGAAAQGIIWGIMAIGVYITYKILDIADLTVDGSICTGACICAVLITNGTPAPLAVLIAALGGAVAGTLTGVLHTVFAIPSILSGILTQLMLYSINIKILGGRSILPLFAKTYTPVMSQLNNPISILVGAIIVAAVIICLWLFFYTKVGLTLKSAGDNPNMSLAQGVNVGFNKIIGLAISNGIVALAGALLAQYQGSADINMGRGAIVIGLAAIFIGLSVSLKIKPNFVVSLIGVVGGGIVYYLVYTFVIFLGIDTELLKMLSAVIVTVFLAVPYVKKQCFSKGKRSRTKTAKEVDTENA